MINELTKEQEAQLAVYKDKWLKIGLCTDRINPKVVTETLRFYYREICNKPEVQIIIMPSPLSAWYSVLLFSILGQPSNQSINWIRAQVRAQIKSQIRGQILDQIRNQVGNQIDDLIFDQVRKQVFDQIGTQIKKKVSGQIGAQIRKQVFDQIRKQVFDQVRKQVFDQVRKQVFDQVETQIKKKVSGQIGDINVDFVFPYLCGHLDSGMFSFFDYCNKVLKVEYPAQEKWDWYVSTTNMGMIFPLNNVCVVSDRPKSIKIKDGILHSENTPAIEYTDGFSVYSLNGVRVNKKIVETSFDKLDAKILFEEENAEVRREIIRKIGIERICKDLNAKVLESAGDYELLTLDLQDGRSRPYLKMKNPSIGCYHIEGVPPDCDTLEKALNSRKPKEMSKIPVDDNAGKDWYQQGDVCIWPKNAKSLKSKPIILT